MKQSHWYKRWIETCHEDNIDPKMMEWVRKYCVRQEDGTWRAINPEQVHTNNPRRRTGQMRRLGWRVYKVKKVKR